MAEDARKRRADTIGRWLDAVEGSVASSLPQAADSSERSSPDRSSPDRVRVDSHLLAAECPAGHLAGQGDFVESARVAAREVALEALRRADGSAMGGSGITRDPIGEVRSILAEPEVLRAGLASWLLEVDRAERAAIAAAAASWMLDALALAARRSEPLWHSPRPRSRNLAEAPVAVTARVDATRPTRSGTHLLVLSPGARRTDARLARHIALVSAVAHGEVPPEVHIGHRDTLTRRSHVIDDGELDTAVGELARAVAWRMVPSGAPRLPGRSCNWCHLAPECPEGSAHLRATRGSPLPPWLVSQTADRAADAAAHSVGPVVDEGPAQGSSGDGAEPTM